MTRSTSRRRLSFAAVVGLAGGGIAFALLRHPESYRELIAAENPSDARSFFSSKSPSAADRIDLQFADGSELVLLFAEGRWHVAAGRRGDAAIREDRAALLFASADGKPELVRWLQAALPPHEGTATLWDRPDVVASFHSENEEIETLMIGRCLMKGDMPRTEVRGRGDERYFLAVGDLTDNFAGSSVLDWIPTRYFPDLDASAIRSIRATPLGGGEGWTIERGEDGAWTVAIGGAPAVRARADRCERAAAALAGLEADALPDAVPADRTVRWAIAFDGAGFSPTVLNVGGETEPGSGLHLAWISDDETPRAIYRPMALLRDGRDIAADDAARRAETNP